ncbi:MAG: carboxypeptidase regulatory-like domain-containing protein, partial [Peptoniphilus sp. oral taxon 375]|nr:carboxypeptidase regulatory-like domain-containing protein [Peptoniphilus sp. oral taxon 375]
RDEEGYSFKEATDIKLQNDDSNKTYTNYVPGKILEKTYIYTKTKEEPQPEPVEQTYSLGDRVWIDDNKDGLQTEGEKGLEGVTVKLTSDDLTEEKTTTTDANGNYKFEGLKNGEYKVTFVKPEGYEITKTNEGTDDKKDSDGTEVTVTIKDADNMTVDLGLVKEEPATPINNPNPKEKEDPKPSEPSTPRTPDPRPNTNPGPKEPNYPIVEEPKDPSPVEEKEKDPASKEESPVQKPVEEVKEVSNKPVEVEKKQVSSKASDDARAPQTFDPGVASYLGLAGLASGLMAYMEDRKRKNK